MKNLKILSFIMQILVAVNLEQKVLYYDDIETLLAEHFLLVPNYVPRTGVSRPD